MVDQLFDQLKTSKAKIEKVSLAQFASNGEVVMDVAIFPTRALYIKKGVQIVYGGHVLFAAPEDTYISEIL